MVGNLNEDYNMNGPLIEVDLKRAHGQTGQSSVGTGEKLSSI